MSKNHNKFMVGAVTAAMVATAIAPVAGAEVNTKADTYSDVATTNSHYANIYKAKELGFMQGNPDGTFEPAKTLTRSNVVKALGKYVIAQSGQTVEQYVEGVTPFSDVPATIVDKELYNYSLVVKKAGIFSGDSNKLNPLNNISRQQMAKVLVNTFGLKDLPNKDSKVTDNASAMAEYRAAINILSENGVTDVTEFMPKSNTSRAQFASFMVRSYEASTPVATNPEVASVSAINATTARVNFKGALPAGVDFTNFEINGGLTVSNVQVSSDRKSAVITVSSEFTRNQEYTVSVFGIKDAEGKEYAETTGKFSWQVAEGVTVALEATTLEQGQTVGLTVKDQAGKDVRDAKVNVTSYNSNLVTASYTDAFPSDVEIVANNAKLAGTTDVVVETTLPDGSKLTNTFKVTVKEAVTTVSNAGYTLVTSLAALEEDAANTAAFKKFATATTSLVEGSGAKELAAFGETNGNPDVAPINFTGATRVVSSNPIVATAVLADNGTNGVITVTPLAVGSTTVTVTMKDGSRKSFPITVTAAPVQKSISVNATNVKLSDENRDEAADTEGVTFQEGVDGHTFKITSLNQFDKAIGFTAGKVTVSSSTEGLALYPSTVNGVADTSSEYVSGANTVTFAGANAAYVTLASKKDTPVTNAKVTVSYFAKTTDTQPTTTKTITVNVTDIDPEALTSSIDVIAGSEIDANAEVSLADSTIEFTSAYALDSKGNRLELVDAEAEIADANSADKFVTVDAATETLQFKSINNALTYLRASNTVNVVVEADGVTKVVPVTYKNTAVVPNKATVATSAVSVKLANNVPSITVEDILFGTPDAAQLILDDADLDASTQDQIVGVLATAKNGGYTYNKPLVSVLGTDGKALATGVNVYGANVASANTWNNDLLEALKGYDTTGFATDDFTVEYEIANSNNSGTTTGGVITPAAGKATTFTLVVRGIYANGSVTAIEGSTPTAAQKAAHNLLAAPVQLNVSVSGQ